MDGRIAAHVPFASSPFLSHTHGKVSSSNCLITSYCVMGPLFRAVPNEQGTKRDERLADHLCIFHDFLFAHVVMCHKLVFHSGFG